MSEHVYHVAITIQMTEQVEQQVCIKLCIKLEHPSMETTRMTQKALGDKAMSAAQMIHVLEGLQQAGHLKMLNVYGLQSTHVGN